MAALTALRNTQRRMDVQRSPYSLKVKASTKIFQGALVVLNAGFAVGGTTATGLVAAGRARKTVDNSAGADGDLLVEVEPGIFNWNNAGGDLVVAADVGQLCYITDDNTVNHTATGKSVAGRVLAIDTDGVWVHTEIPFV